MSPAEEAFDHLQKLISERDRLAKILDWDHEALVRLDERILAQQDYIAGYCDWRPEDERE